jgi:hypothetical protein
MVRQHVAADTALMVPDEVRARHPERVARHD